MLNVNLNNKEGKIVILTTGGTIAGKGELGKITGYIPGQMSATELVNSVPNLTKLASIEVIDVCKLNSDDIDGNIWLKIAKIINEKAKEPEVLGFVITHGTDTMDETAYFLHITVKTDKPVVLTGAMRPATSFSADGVMNLYEAVSVASNENAKNKGVMIVFSDEIFSARYMTKSNTSSVTTMNGGKSGAMGSIIDNNLYFNYNINKLHTKYSEFDITNINELKKVSVVYFNVEANKDIFKYTIEHSDGVVVAGAGMGCYSNDFIEIINEAKIPIVISSRTGSGIITESSLLNKNAISAFDLPPQKAAVLLRVALTFNKNVNEIREIFLKY